VTLVVRFCALGLNVLLDAVDLRLVADQTLLNVVQSVVDVGLQNLVLAGFVLHSVESGLLLQLALILFNHVFDQMHALLLLLELPSQVVDLAELVLHGVLHVVDSFCDSLHLFVNTHLQVLYLIQVSGSRLNFNLQFGCCHFSIIKLALLEFQILSHVINRLLAGQTPLSLQILLHVLKQSRNDLLVV